MQAVKYLRNVVRNITFYTLLAYSLALEIELITSKFDSNICTMKLINNYSNISSKKRNALIKFFTKKNSKLC